MSSEEEDLFALFNILSADNKARFKRLMAMQIEGVCEVAHCYLNALKHSPKQESHGDSFFDEIKIALYTSRRAIARIFLSKTMSQPNDFDSLFTPLTRHVETVDEDSLGGLLHQLHLLTLIMVDEPVFRSQRDSMLSTNTIEDSITGDSHVRLQTYQSGDSGDKIQENDICRTSSNFTFSHLTKEQDNNSDYNSQVVENRKVPNIDFFRFYKSKDSQIEDEILGSQRVDLNNIDEEDCNSDDLYNTVATNIFSNKLSLVNIRECSLKVKSPIKNQLAGSNQKKELGTSYRSHQNDTEFDVQSLLQERVSEKLMINLNDIEVIEFDSNSNRLYFGGEQGFFCLSTADDNYKLIKSDPRKRSYLITLRVPSICHIHFG